MGPRFSVSRRTSPFREQKRPFNFAPVFLIFLREFPRGHDLIRKIPVPPPHKFVIENKAPVRIQQCLRPQSVEKEVDVIADVANS